MCGLLVENVVNIDSQELTQTFSLEKNELVFANSVLVITS